MDTIGQVDKEKFILDMSEDEFREKLVRRLFKALGYHDGRDTCGPEEFGKDAIFTELDKFGIETFTAVQTKVGNINLAGDPSKNLHTILAQLRTALDQKHVCAHEKKKVLPLCVYLISSGTINQAARNYIVDQVNDPRLRFLDRDDLIAKVDETCPELWAGIVADVSPYLKELARRVEDLSLTDTSNPLHAPIGLFAAASDQRFVDVRLGHHRLIQRKRLGEVTEDFEYEETAGTQLFTSSSSVRALVLGDAGSGKSTLVMRLAYLIAKRAIVATRNYHVPVCVRASDLVGKASKSVYNTVAELVKRSASLTAAPFVLDDFEGGRIVLLIDGLDELAETKDRQDVVDYANLFCEQYPKCSIAITSRPYSSIEEIIGLDKFERFRISPLNMKDASKMLQAMQTPGAPVDASWRKEVLRRLDGVYGIELNPLLVTVFAVSAGAERRDIPANITELFAKFTELMLGRWDERKGLAQQYQSKVKDHLLSLFAFNLQRSGDTEFCRADFVSFAAERLAEMNLSADLAVVVSETLDRSGLFRGDDDHLEFKHHLLQEFFASRGIPDIDFVRSIVGDEWWQNPVVFYFGGKPGAVDELLDVATSSHTDATKSFQTIGLALQACYLSRIEDRVDAWKWVVGGASQAALKWINSSDSKYPIISFLTDYLMTRDAVALSGIDVREMGVEAWACAGSVSEADELRRFWYVVALIELGRFDAALRVLKSHRFARDMLACAIHFGALFSSDVREVSAAERDGARAVCAQLERQVQPLRVLVAHEFKGQLLEYRQHGVIALDQEEKQGSESTFEGA